MTQDRGYPVRLAAVQTLTRVMKGQSLTTALSAAAGTYDGRDAALLSQLCYSTLRHWFSLNAFLEKLMKHPLRARDLDIKALLLTGLCQLHHSRIPAHAAVDTSVRVARVLGKKWACGLVNAVLRKSLNSDGLMQEALSSTTARSELPQWLYQRLADSWHDQLDALIAGMNSQAPMTLRINTAATSRAAYDEQLRAAGMAADLCSLSSCGIQLETATAVDKLPGFGEGQVSVQDEAAQLAAVFLDCQSGDSVLDACAAPGGKTCHLLEATPHLELTAVELDAERLPRIQDNLERLQLQASLIRADASEPDTWWNGEAYDRILVDAPCSATGVIRRHPDIKLLRRKEDIESLVQIQAKMLDALWPLLKPGGRLLYATCSVLTEENSHQIARFLSVHEDAEEKALQLACKTPDTDHGLQLLPAPGGHDGFFYACLEKTGTADHG